MTENGMEGVVTSIMPFLKVRLISMALIVSLQRRSTTVGRRQQYFH